MNSTENFKWIDLKGNVHTIKTQKIMSVVVFRVDNRDWLSW